MMLMVIYDRASSCKILKNFDRKVVIRQYPILSSAGQLFCLAFSSFFYTCQGLAWTCSGHHCWAGS